MPTARRVLIAAFAIAAVSAAPAAAPAAAEAATYAKCGALGGAGKPLATRIRAKALACDRAITQVAKWIETRGAAPAGTHRVSGFRCRGRRIGRGVYGVTCSDRDGPAVVKFRYLRKNR